VKRLVGLGVAALGAAVLASPEVPATGLTTPAPSSPSGERSVLADIPSSQARTKQRRATHRLLYHGGLVLHANRTHVIFWQPATSGLRFDPGYQALVNAFMANVAAASHRTSNLFALTGQYTDGTHRPAAYSSRYGGAVLDTDRLPANGCVEPPVTGPGWTVCLSDQQLQTELEHVVRSHRLPTGRRDVYLLLTPRGFGSCLGTSPTTGCALGGSVNGYCGYHSPTQDGLLRYAVIPFNAVAGHCQSNAPRPNHSTADPALSTVSHELSETITDPYGDAWSTSSGSENGDLCATSYGHRLGGSGSDAYNQVINGAHYYLQEEWSNASGSCQLRARPDRASFSVSRRAAGPHGVSFHAAAAAPDGRIVAYRWWFGDGRTGSGRQVSHRYASRGAHTVRLRVTDSWDNWQFSVRRVRVS
jgi:PKD domain